jgi:hypothetical protein
MPRSEIALGILRLLYNRYQGKVPAVASCATGQRKFFTPSYLYRAPFAAQEYLLGRYDLHDCPGDPKKRAPLVAWQQTEG